MVFFIRYSVIQKKFCFLDLGDQEKLKLKAELTSCISIQINSMYTMHAMNQDSRGKDYLLVFVFIDGATSLKHYNNYYFSTNPKSVFVAHYHEEGKNTRTKDALQCHYCNMFFRYKQKFNKHINIALDVQALFTVFKMKILSVTKTIWNIKKIFPSLWLGI